LQAIDPSTRSAGPRATEAASRTRVGGRQPRTRPPSTPARSGLIRRSCRPPPPADDLEDDRAAPWRSTSRPDACLSPPARRWAAAPRASSSRIRGVRG